MINQDLTINIRGIKSTLVNMDHTIDIELEDVDKKFIQDLEIKDIISNADNKKLLRAMIENDPKLLTDFLKEKRIEVLT